MALKKLVIIASVVLSFAAIAAVVKFSPSESAPKDDNASNYERVMGDESAKSVSYY